MAVRAIKEYKGEVKDRHENFHGNQLLYVGWDNHLMFCAPLAFCFPPSMPFAELQKTLEGAFAYHPEAKSIDWTKAEWLKSSQPWTPDASKTLGENGLKHKDALRFRIPGLNGIKGCST